MTPHTPLTRMAGPVARQRRVLAVLVAMLVLAGCGSSGVEVAVPTRPPESTAGPRVDGPVGLQLAWFLSVLNGTDPTDAEIAGHFTEAFLASVPPATFRAVNADVRAASALPLVVEEVATATPTHARVQIVDRRGQPLVVTIAVETAPPHLIDGLLIRPGAVAPSFASWEELASRWRDLAPQASLLVAEVVDGACQPLVAVEAETSRAVGSAFKLYVLGALLRAIEAGKLAWDTPVEVKAELRSLPTGTMQSKPVGSTLPLEEVATLMISISDNTATDHLIHLIGRERVEAAQAEMRMTEPARNLPFLTTRELFVLKLVLPPDEVDAYLGAGTEERRRILAGPVAAANLSVLDALKFKGPRLVDTVEWFLSSADLCRAMVDLSESSTGVLAPAVNVLSTNPGVAIEGTDFPRVFFKGGSEPGVLNLTWLVTRADGRQFAVTGTLNNTTKAVPEEEAIALLSGAFPFLAEN